MPSRSRSQSLEREAVVSQGSGDHVCDCRHLQFKLYTFQFRCKRPLKTGGKQSQGSNYGSFRLSLVIASILSILETDELLRGLP